MTVNSPFFEDGSDRSVPMSSSVVSVESEARARRAFFTVSVETQINLSRQG